MAHELPIFKELENDKIHITCYTKHHLISLISQTPYIFLEPWYVIILKDFSINKAPALVTIIPNSSKKKSFLVF